jgi:hypothetical protein
VSRLALEPTQPPVQWMLGALSLGVKKSGLEGDHTPPSSSEVKNGGPIPPVPHTSSWHSVQGHLYLFTSVQFSQTFWLVWFVLLIAFMGYLTLQSVAQIIQHKIVG